MANVTLNVILVGVERFTAEDRRKVNEALRIMRTIYLSIGLHFSIDRFKMPVAQCRGLMMTPITDADAEAITQRVAGPDGTIDMFVVRQMVGGAGVTKVDGPCNKRRSKRMTGVVVALTDLSFTDNDARRGTVFAHEVGHYLGLDHCPCGDPACNDNLMRGGGCSTNSNTAITAQQAVVLMSHCAVTP